MENRSARYRSTGDWIRIMNDYGILADADHCSGTEGLEAITKIACEGNTKDHLSVLRSFRPSRKQLVSWLA